MPPGFLKGNMSKRAESPFMRAYNLCKSLEPIDKKHILEVLRSDTALEVKAGPKKRKGNENPPVSDQALLGKAH